MTWAKLDDTFMHHPKFVALEQHYGDDTDTYMAAIGLWSSALAYCSAYLTDGHIAQGAIRRLYPGTTPTHLIAGLVFAGLWETTATGWATVDYLQHNDSAETVRARRVQAAAAGREGGLARAGKGGRRPPNPPRGGGSNNGRADQTPSAPPSTPPSDPLSEQPSDRPSDRSSSPLHSTPLTEKRFVGEVSSSSGGPGDDDETTVDRALEAIGTQRHVEALRAGQVRNTSRGGKRAHKRSCVDDCLDDAELRAAARATIQAHPDWPIDLIAETVEAESDKLATVHDLPIRYPTCPHCGKNHDQRSLCWFDPAHPRHAEVEP